MLGVQGRQAAEAGDGVQAVSIDWILMAPQYHAFMGVIGVACLVLLIRLNRRIK